MAEEKKTIVLSFEVTGKGATMIRNLDGDLKKFKLTTEQAELAAKKLGTTVNQLSNVSVKQTTKEFQKFSGQMSGVTTATGSATAAALELGRVVSDMPYGIRGVANNLSQLSSNLIYASTVIDTTTGKAIGLGGAFKAMFRALSGPLGLLLVIQGVIAAFDAFSNSTKKAKEETDELDKSLANAASTIKISTERLEVYAKVYKEGTSNTRAQTNALDELKKLGFDPAIESIDKFIERQKELIIVQATSNVFKKQLEELVEARVQSDSLIEDSNQKLNESFEKLEAARKIAAQGGLMRGERQAEISQNVSDAERDYNEALQENIELTEQRGNIFLNIADKSKEYREELERLLELQSPKRRKGATGKEKIGAIDPIFGDVDELMEGYDIAFNLQLEYQRKLNESRAFLSDEQLLIQSETNRKLLEMEIEHNEKMLIFDEEGSMAAIERKNEINSLQIDLRNADLEHELMIIEQKKNAQMEYANYVAQIGNILARISGKNKDIALLALAVQKGAAIANVVIKNREANASIMQKATSDASESTTAGMLAIARGTTMLATGNPAGALAVKAGKGALANSAAILAQAKGATAKNKISAGLSIAAILASSLSSRGLGGTTSGGGGGAGVSGAGGVQSREFDFNLVGSTGVNQLAQGIAAQFSQQPIQAYVVSSQMTSQQQLDHTIQTQASLGN